MLTQLINKHFSILGIDQQQIYNSDKFNARILMAFIVNSLCIFSSIKYLLHGVHGSIEYMECLYTAISAFASAVAFTILTWKSEKLFEILNEFGSIIQTSE